MLSFRICISYTSLPCFIALHFTADRTENAFFYKLKVCGNTAPSKSNSTIFPTAFARFLSSCQILIILTIFPTVSLLLYLWWSVISDL